MTSTSRVSVESTPSDTSRLVLHMASLADNTLSYKDLSATKIFDIILVKLTSYTESIQTFPNKVSSRIFYFPGMDPFGFLDPDTAIYGLYFQHIPADKRLELLNLMKQYTNNPDRPSEWVKKELLSAIWKINQTNEFLWSPNP